MIYNKFVIYGIIVLLMGSGLGSVFAHCPAENLQDSGWFTTGIEWIYGSASAGNLTYWPFGVLGQAYISSDHSIYAESYHEDDEFDAYWKFRIFIDDWQHQYFDETPVYGGTLPEYDPLTQVLPVPLEDSETLWVNVHNLPAPRAGKEYFMSATTRLDVYWGRLNNKKHSWKDCVNSVSFTHFPPP